MGIEGMVLALGVLFTFAYVVPLLAKQRRVLASTPTDERFCEELRLIETGAIVLSAAPDAAQTSHGRIYPTERTMMTKKEAAVQLRAVARDRSRARARIAQRRALTKRGILLTVALVAATVGLWIAVAAASVPIAIAVISTLVTGVFTLAFGFAAREWAVQDGEDQHTIAGANRLLAAHKRANANRAPVKQERGVTGKKPARQLEAAPAAASAQPVAEVEAEPVRAERNTRRATAQVKTAAATAPNESRMPAEKVMPAPSYTLKPTIQKRVVKPFAAPEQPTAAVPYRPTKVGEKLSEETLAPANPAPEMTGNEELRADVLGGGATLDELLARRRA
ncbi:MAG: hypothetical protein Q4E03_00965 [Trueperella sp.]|nr:hypothetical protein [Trueperella sp.]